MDVLKEDVLVAMLILKNSIMNTSVHFQNLYYKSSFNGDK